MDIWVVSGQWRNVILMYKYKYIGGVIKYYDDFDDYDYKDYFGDYDDDWTDWVVSGPLERCDYRNTLPGSKCADIRPNEWSILHLLIFTFIIEEDHMNR